jgi:hypothetical protein
LKGTLFETTLFGLDFQPKHETGNFYELTSAELAVGAVI